jgi:hypothetical protein
MEDILYKGQWQGFFKYGPGYGAYLNGKEAEFRLFIEEYNNGGFSGRVIDWEGIGAEGAVSKLNGFIKGNFISFIKEYSQLLLIDELGNMSTHNDNPGHTVAYEGNYDPLTKSFYGSWEISTDIKPIGQYWLEQVNGGTWRMSGQE